MAVTQTKTSRLLLQFLHAETTGGVVMLLATALALLLANSGAAAWYEACVEMPLQLTLGTYHMAAPLKEWVKDGPMVLFFLLIGMELKREMLEGFLADRQQIFLPLLAAMGGMAMPALVFLGVNYATPLNWNGWAIASATDIAFALCVLMLAGKKLPPALKIFLLAIAIFDDLGAILIIALFYNGAIAALPLLMAAVTILMLYLLNRWQVMAIAPYLLLGAVLALFLYHSGVHSTIAGVIVGMAIPLRDGNNVSSSPLNRCLRALHPWVVFAVLPLFAFTAAGMDLRGLTADMLLAPLTLGIALGLVVGKQIGIFGTTWLLVKWRFASLPEGTHWGHIYGVSLLAGIGFTMSLFIGILAFDTAAMHAPIKLGVLTGSIMSALLGWLVFRRAASQAIVV